MFLFFLHHCFKCVTWRLVIIIRVSRLTQTVSVKQQIASFHPCRLPKIICFLFLSYFYKFHKFTKFLCALLQASVHSLPWASVHRPSASVHCFEPLCTGPNLCALLYALPWALVRCPEHRCTVPSFCALHPNSCALPSTLSVHCPGFCALHIATVHST